MMVKNIAVIGAAGGVAETVAQQIIALHSNTKSPIQRVTVLLDDRPRSPTLLAAAQSTTSSPISLQVIYGDFESNSLQVISNRPGSSSSVDLKQLLDQSIVVGVDDYGDAILRAEILADEFGRKIERRNKGVELLNKVSKLAPLTNLHSVICGMSLENEKMSNQGGLTALFSGSKGGSITWKRLCEGTNGNVPYMAIKYGELTGGIKGAEAVPFMSLPLQEPELHPSYILQSLVCSTTKNNPYAATEKCTRDALGETLARLALLQSELSKAQLQSMTSMNNQAGIDALLISIAGPAPSEKDWSLLFKRMISTGDDIELLRLEFAEIPKLALFSKWIAETWFTSALLEANTATIVSGARPVRAMKVNDNLVRIVWEDLQSDMTVKKVGSLEITLHNQATPAYLSVVRNSPTMLPSEIQIVDRLIEAVNTNGIKKQFVVPLATAKV